MKKMDGWEHRDSIQLTLASGSVVVCFTKIVCQNLENVYFVMLAQPNLEPNRNILKVPKFSTF